MHWSRQIQAALRRLAVDVAAILIRLDDFTPSRHIARWDRVAALLAELGIRPIVAVVPKDKYFGSVDTPPVFWEDVRGLAARGWTIGVHGLTHDVRPIADTGKPEVFFATKAEFVGADLDTQMSMIREATEEFCRNGVESSIFIAPNHGFDAVTVEALRRVGRLPVISDGISLRAFRHRGLIWLPQIDWAVPLLAVGFRTVCLHPCTMSERDFSKLASGLTRHRRSIVCFEDIGLDVLPSKGPLDAAFEGIFRLFFLTRNLAAGLRK